MLCTGNKGRSAASRGGGRHIVRNNSVKTLIDVQVHQPAPLVTLPHSRYPLSLSHRGPRGALPQDNTTEVPPPSQSEDTSEERPLDLPTPAERAIRLGPVPHPPPEFGNDEFTDGGRPAHAWAEDTTGMMEAGAVTQPIEPFLRVGPLERLNTVIAPALPPSFEKDFHWY
jgi:hypothetical protein